jgi:hypothetical protein
MDMNLYQEILFLKYYYKERWAVENVISFYEPPIKPFKLGRHYIWSNFLITDRDFEYQDIRALSGTSAKDKLLRNAVEPELGLHILNESKKEVYKELFK